MSAQKQKHLESDSILKDKVFKTPTTSMSCETLNSIQEEISEPDKVIDDFSDFKTPLHAEQETKSTSRVKFSLQQSLSTISPQADYIESTPISSVSDFTPKASYHNNEVTTKIKEKGNANNDRMKRISERAQAIAPTSQASNTNCEDLQYNLITEIVNNAMTPLESQIHNELSNMHVEIISQFHVQKVIIS